MLKYNPPLTANLKMSLEIIMLVIEAVLVAVEAAVIILLVLHLKKLTKHTNTMDNHIERIDKHVVELDNNSERIERDIVKMLGIMEDRMRRNGVKE